MRTGAAEDETEVAGEDGRKYVGVKENRRGKERAEVGEKGTRCSGGERKRGKRKTKEGRRRGDATRRGRGRSAKKKDLGGTNQRRGRKDILGGRRFRG